MHKKSQQKAWASYENLGNTSIKGFSLHLKDAWHLNKKSESAVIWRWAAHHQ